MRDDFFKISRIDKAVVDNLGDIERTFKENSGIVQDFIVFITKQIKFDLFGYTSFTIADFCRETGRNRQDLALIHPLFKASKEQPPTFNGFRFLTVFDYCLYLMLEKNIVFSNSYPDGDGVHLESFSILKDVKLNLNRKKTEIKIYEVRVSDDILNGFIRRYYSLNTFSYRLVGKGRGGDNRKKLLIFLSRTMHILHSKNQHYSLFPCDVLFKVAGIESEKKFHKKLALTRLLEYIKNKGQFSFEYEFVRNNSAYQYYVQISFPEANALAIKRDHFFYYTLINDLQNTYKYLKDKKKYYDERDPFQAWFVDDTQNIQLKASALIKAYEKYYTITLTEAEAVQMIKTNDILRQLKN